MNNSTAEFPPIGENLKRERLRHHLSLGELAKSSGISKAMLSQIEAGKVNPTLVTLWKVAHALSVEITSLISSGKEPDYFYKLSAGQQAMVTEDGVQFKILSAPDLPKGLEMYHVLVAPGAHHESEPHPEGCKEFVMVLKGSIGITSGSMSATLGEGDFLAYNGSLAHTIDNPGGECAELHMIVFN